MGKLTSMSYRRTINLGNYESATFEATCEVDYDATSVQDDKEWLIAFVTSALENEHGIPVRNKNRTPKP